SGPLSSMNSTARMIAILIGTAVTVMVIQVLRSLGTAEALNYSNGDSDEA
ncbi:MAG: hypothetical protein GY852_07925, partial [bacterium]|nr:hypothetical protein [bacterium]